MNGNDLASQIAKGNKPSGKKKSPDYWGFDELGFEWPNPVNSEAVVASVLCRYDDIKGVCCIYRVGDDLFVNGKKVKQTSAGLLGLLSQPHIVLWTNYDPNNQDELKVWKQIKHIVATEYPIVFNRLLELVEEYNRRYIRVSKNYVWDTENSEFIFKQDS